MTSDEQAQEHAREQAQTEWNAVRMELIEQVDPDAYECWIEPLVLQGVQNGVVTLGGSSRFFCDRVRSSYGSQLKAAWKTVEPSVRKIELVVIEPKRPAESETDAPAAAQASSAPARAAEPDPTASRLERLKATTESRLSSFSEFVVGRPNEFAHAACKRVAEDPDAPFSPLFVHGQSGLGKTHLLQSIVRRRLELFPDQTVVMLTAEQFLNEFTNSLRTRSTLSFKDLFRSLDMLVIDDVHTLIGKTTTQEEFFHTFDALAGRGKHIVLSADRTPTELTGVDPRLTGRWISGLVADVHPTDYELRFAILQQRAEEALRSAPDVDLDPKVLEFLARRLSADVRTLSGALRRLIALATLLSRPVTVDLAQRELQDLLRKSDKKVSVEEIQKRVADHFGIHISDMQSDKRTRQIARPRQVAMYLCKKLTARSYPDIGRKFGGRDHTTVIHAHRKVDELRRTDAMFDEDVERLRRDLES